MMKCFSGVEKKADEKNPNQNRIKYKQQMDHKTLKKTQLWIMHALSLLATVTELSARQSTTLIQPKIF